MEQKRLYVETTELIETYRELLPKVESLPLVVSGNSMSPFLIENRDSVRLYNITRPIKVGDILLYKRDNGQYILHRVCGVKNNSFSMIGDAHDIIENGVRKDQIIAIVNTVQRDGKILAPGDVVWDFFEKIWIRIIPIRKRVLPILARIYNLFRRK